jgi:hypothetical protein
MINRVNIALHWGGTLRTIRFVILLMVGFLIILSGCIKNTSSIQQANNTSDQLNDNSSLKHDKEIAVHISESVYLIDKDGKNVSNQTIYLSDTQFLNSSSQWRAKGNSRLGTDINGTVSGGESNLLFNPGDYIVYGASTDSSLLDEDYVNHQFNPGKAGYWSIVTYEDIQKVANGHDTPVISINITVSNETGMMLKKADSVQINATGHFNMPPPLNDATPKPM